MKKIKVLNDDFIKDNMIDKYRRLLNQKGFVKLYF